MSVFAKPVRSRLDMLEVPGSCATTFADDVVATLGYV